jgi:hypothetical protein
MKAIYTSDSKFSVNVTGKYNGFVPRDHKNWTAWGIDLLEDNGLIEDLPLPVEPLPPTPEELTATKVSEAKQYLASTDFKMLTDYDQDVVDVKVLRAEARALVRELGAI